MTLRAVSQAELERRGAFIEADFRGGWIPAGAGQQQTPTAGAHAGGEQLQCLGWPGRDGSPHDSGRRAFPSTAPAVGITSLEGCDCTLRDRP